MVGGDEAVTFARNPEQAGQQAQAVQSASAVFEQLLEEVEGAARGEAGPDQPGPALTGHSSDQPAGDWGLNGLRATVMQSLDLYSDLLRQILGLYSDAIQGSLERNRAGRQEPAHDRVELSGMAGSMATARLWLHNTTAQALPPTRLRLTELFGHDGSRLALAATFDPPTVEVPAGESAEIRLEVPIPAEIASGTYHGYALGLGLPEAAAQVHLLVTP